MRERVKLCGWIEDLVQEYIINVKHRSQLQIFKQYLRSGLLLDPLLKFIIKNNHHFQTIN